MLTNKNNLALLSGRLLVFEGPDGVGKTTLSHHLRKWLCSEGIDCDAFSFPGHENGSLGKLIYDIHHNPSFFGLQRPSADSLQMLHVTAHIDTISSRIIPALKSGKTVILDRYWWSTVVYGMAGGIHRDLLNHLICIEKLAWRNVIPSMIFLVECAKDRKREQEHSQWMILKE